MTQDNRKRALAEIATLEAWHKAFTARRKTTDLIVDVVFTVGRIGSEDEAPVRFRLSLKSAEVVVIVPDLEPATIDRMSISRDAPHAKITVKDTTSAKGQIGGQAGVSLKAGLHGLAPGANMAATLSGSRDNKRVIDKVQDRPMIVTQRRTPDEDYLWEIKPTIEGVPLEGRPWIAQKHPRLKIKDTRRDRTTGIEPSVRVELRCLREDLHITDIELKGGSLRDKLEFHRNKLAAAEAVIRTRLATAGLLTGRIDDPYAKITLSAVISEGQS